MRSCQSKSQSHLIFLAQRSFVQVVFCRVSRSYSLFLTVPHHTVGAPSFASCEIAYPNQNHCGRKGWVNKTPNANDLGAYKIPCMPKGLRRWYGGGDLHFITSSCYQRKAFLGSASRRDLFLKILEQVRQKYEFSVVGYVVMPEHFHLLIGEPDDGNVAVAMQVLKQRVSRLCWPGAALVRPMPLLLRHSGIPALMTSTYSQKRSSLRNWTTFTGIL